jgi:hypothetical protein
MISVVFAQNQDVFTDVSTLVYEVIAVCYAIITPLLLLGIMIGYIEIAGPWGLQTLKKAGRMQIELGFITLVVFLVSPALLALIAYIGASLSASAGAWP